MTITAKFTVVKMEGDIEILKKVVDRIAELKIKAEKHEVDAIEIAKETLKDEMLSKFIKTAIAEELRAKVMLDPLDYYATAYNTFKFELDPVDVLNKALDIACRTYVNVVRETGVEIL